MTKVCAHCGRICGDHAGGYASVDGQFVCHPNFSDRPDCYHLITVYKEPLGKRIRIEARKRLAESLRSNIAYWLVGEWICCEPVNPLHHLCVFGNAARQMMEDLLADDVENFPATSPILDAAIDALFGPADAKDPHYIALRQHVEQHEIHELKQKLAEMTERERQAREQAFGRSD